MTFFKKNDFPRCFILYKKGLQLSLQVFLSFSSLSHFAVESVSKKKPSVLTEGFLREERQ